jgi:hypothetical protein
VDQIGSDKASPDLGPDRHREGTEVDATAPQDSAGSLLSIKVRRRSPPRPRNDAQPTPKPNGDMPFAATRNGADVAPPEEAPAQPAPKPAMAAAAPRFGQRDPLPDAGPSRPAEPPRRRRPDEIVTYWTHLRVGRRFPALADIDLSRIAEDWPNSLMIRRRAGSRVLEAERIGGGGTVLGTARGEDESAAPIDVSPLLLQWLLSLAGEVTETQRPMGDTESFPSLRKSVVYRAFALPLSDDQKEVNHILCHVCLED